MSKAQERDVTCGRCDTTFRGHGRGEHAINQAYQLAGHQLLSHDCVPPADPEPEAGPIPRVTRARLRAIVSAVKQAMPDVTITSHKV